MSITFTVEHVQTTVILSSLQLYSGQARIAGILFAAAFNNLQWHYTQYRLGNVRLGSVRAMHKRFTAFLDKARSMGVVTSTQKGVSWELKDDQMIGLIQLLRHIDTVE
jgi:hypothetical protein